MKLHIYRNGKAETIEVDGWVCDETGEWAICGGCDASVARRAALSLAIQSDKKHVSTELTEHALEMQKIVDVLDGV